MEYFSLFPKIEYVFNGEIYKVPDISIRHFIKTNILNDEQVIYKYSYKDNDRPDIIATTYYGHPKYTWVVLLSASLYNPIFDVPLPQDVFEKYLINKYNKDLNELQNEVKYYNIDNRYNVDLLTYNSYVGNKKIVSVYDYEYQLNEDRRIIKLISRKYLPQIENEFKDRMKRIKSSNEISKT